MELLFRNNEHESLDNLHGGKERSLQVPAITAGGMLIQGS